MKFLEKHPTPWTHKIVKGSGYGEDSEIIDANGNLVISAHTDEGSYSEFGGEPDALVEWVNSL